MRINPPNVSFQTYRLKGSLLNALKDLRMEEPNPVQKQVMKAIMAGRDVVVASLLKEHAERAALIMAMNEIAKEPEPVGTKVLVLTSDDSRANKAAAWIGKLGKNVEGFTTGTLLETQDPKENLDMVSRGPTVLVSAPELLQQVMRTHGIRLFGLQMILAENVAKYKEPAAVRSILESASGLFRRVIHVARPNNVIMDEVIQWVGDPEWIGLDPWNASSEETEPAQSQAEAEGKGEAEGKSEGEADGKASKPTKVSVTLIGKPKKKVVNLTQDPREAKSNAAAANGDASSQAPDDGAEESASRVIKPKGQPQALPETTKLHFAVIPDGSQIAAMATWIRKDSTRRTLGYVIGPSESDTLFRELRESDVPLISVHSRLRRSTYDYRLSRFLSHDVNTAIIGGNLKSDEKPEDVQCVLFSYVPDRGETFQEHLSRLTFAGSDTDVVVLVERSKLPGFQDWVAKTGYGFMLAAPTVLGDLQEPEPSESSAGSGRGDRPRRQESAEPKGSTGGSRESTGKGGASRSEASSKGKSAKPASGKPGGGSGEKEDSKRGGRPATGGRGGRSGSGRSESGRGGNRSKSGRSEGRGGEQRREGRGQRGGSGSPNRGRGDRSQQPRKNAPDNADSTRYGLPKPSYEKLEHGKSGRQEEKKGLLGSIKRLFGG